MPNKNIIFFIVMFGIFIAIYFFYAFINNS